MKKKLLLLVLTATLMLPAQLPASAEGANGVEKLVLIPNSPQMIHNDKTVTAPQPLTAVKGVTYVAARSFMNEIYGKIEYNSKSKQYTLKSGKDVLVLQEGKTNYSLNGKAKNYASGAPFAVKGTLMIPVRVVADSFGISVRSVENENTVELTWSTSPIAKFSVSDLNPYAEQTEVKYKDESFHPRGLKIIEERWENNNAIFDESGTYTVTHWVKDENGTWSEPYSVVVTVKPPNQPPVAYFNTEKETYKMGEFIKYEDLSTDDEDQIASRVWTGNERGFFEPGEKTVTLKVTDSHGLVGEYTKTITILDETLYTKEEFNLLYTNVGEKFDINGPAVLQLQKINYNINDRPQTLIRANSPETILEEGIYYEDNVTGNVRFLLHNLNGRSTPVKSYVIVTNQNAEPVTVRMGAKGIGGPNIYVSTVGRAVTGRFLESLLNPKYSYLQVPAGESRLLFPEYSDKAMKPGDVYSMFADVQISGGDLDFKVVVADANRDVMSYLPYAKVLPSHDIHIRGTFENANRIMYVNQTIGDVKSRMVLADNIEDTRLSGIDKTTGTPVLNAGNYGVVYTIQLGYVLPNTAIVVNPRGGHYAGAFTVNGKVVYTTNDSILRNPNEVGVLYKTGDSAEAVTITFTPANGSMLPINLLFLPMPTH
ncbi:copper amine oxidase N-terminal domain-containing protein [Cohnella terricola]|uniref:Copper amine oxidase N-terminal domain-containing protein n=1 Tax=Cohnella terricola TaxID=1289167 RepID=A0A559JQV0_9BACL|nr:copper amine oxidase N-terminal domain-containing protein [Cohnella terricola]TVY02251.1 copper amine oxidase N-terminal domain-containing protein [Cohnella terricola]